MTLVLVVDDDDDLRETLDGVFTARGFRVLAARHGLDAIELVRRSGLRPSTILLDLVMPRMDGVAFLAAQQHEPLLVHVPVILHTGERIVPEPLPATVKTVIRKPAKLGDLLLAIERCVIDAATPPSGLAHGTGSIPPVVTALPEPASEPGPEPAPLVEPAGARPGSEPTEPSE